MQAVRRRLRRRRQSPQGSLDRTYVCVCVYVFLYIYECMRLGTKIIGGKIYEKHFDKHFDDNFDMWLIDKILLNCFHTNDNKM